MQIVCAGEDAPFTLTKSLFLAGPTPRSKAVSSWRPQALKLLESLGYDGIVFIPETREGGMLSTHAEQVEWEERYLNMADCITFWIPREMSTMPALTTSDEWGVWKNSGKVVLGTPLEAVHVRYQAHYAKKYCVPIEDTLQETLEEALKVLGNGAHREGGEREVPLHIWRTSHFQNWYKNLKLAGNRLDGAKVHWTFRTGPEKKFVFLWALHVNVFVTSENRNKINEFVIARPDISTIVLYRRRPEIMDSEIILVREFRSPVSNKTGFVWEVAGGSSFKNNENPSEVVSAECEEETGLSIKPSRFQSHECRQMVATLSAHRAHLFSVEITETELEQVRKDKGNCHGVAADSEMTFVEVDTVRGILEKNHVDWSMLGMILSILHRS